MQVPLPQQVLWQPMMASAEHYVTAAPPAPSVVLSQTLAHDGLVSVPFVLKNGWMVQGIPQTPHQAPTYLPQPLHYVAVQPRLVENGGIVEKQATAEAFNNRTLLVPRGPTRGSDVILGGRSLCGSSFAARRQSEENCDGRSCLHCLNLILLSSCFTFHYTFATNKETAHYQSLMKSVGWKILPVEAEFHTKTLFSFKKTRVLFIFERGG